MNCYEILEQIRSTSSRLEKIEILKTHKTNDELKRVLYYAMSPFVLFYIKKIPHYTHCQADISLEKSLDQLGAIRERKVTGQSAIDYLAGIFNSLSHEDQLVLERIIQKDLKAGIDAKTINKVFPNLIETSEVMLAHKDISGIVYPAIAQKKYDGARMHLKRVGNTSVAVSRNGKTYELLGETLYYTAKSMMCDGEEWDGELVFVDHNGNYLDRKTSNGLATKAIRGTLSEEEAKRARFIVWDIVDRSSKISYNDRLDVLETCFSASGCFSKFVLAEYEVVHSLEEAEAFFQKMLALGEEGAVLKNANGVWVPTRTKDMGKMKAEEEADLLCYGIELGEVGSKYEGMIGALKCKTRDDKLFVSVGTGLSDADRALDHDAFVGKIVTVRYNQLIKDKNRDTMSLFLPRLIEVREDKSEANFIHELK